ncbi:SMC family ATPase [Leptolyngbya boryana CZ1]|uniref:Nuclease SbcCD subunit C n=1 Tax=Leptolyngbya boryana CZ1 TaxID=3060204 RepID=A0AA97ASB0_LEPBY|nr:SMC family ATPase [Leptolyngbya boryana]WNZ48232.1 SMC family ATPase [Leptolyngbya boryana CZ1]
MIPQRLTLRNFLSYQEATLDFRGLHTACVCGANGAGKSSLLEAISWVIWGESRAASEDDVIHMGAKEAQVEFIFGMHQQIYRVLRTRQRGQGISLEFQIMQDGGFRSLTAKGIRSTQQLILSHLKIDYDTFVNSAYLRQGRADEFMLKRPAERKQILADLLKLHQYDTLAEQAKDKSRQFKGQVDLLERNLEAIREQLQQRDAIEQERAELEALLTQMQAQQAASNEQLQQLQAVQHQRQTWRQQLSWQQQQQRNLNQDCQRLQKERSQTDQQRQTLEKLLQQEATIIAGYRHWQALQAQEEAFSAKFQAHQVAQSQRQQHEQQQSEKIQQLQNQLQKVQAQEITLQEQLQEVEKALTKEADVEAAVQNLIAARQELQQLDQLQLQASPLLQRRQQLQKELDRASTRLSARLEELRTSARQLQTQQQRQPSLKKAAVEVAVKIEELEKLRAYQDQVLEKGLERRGFVDQLQAHQRNYEAQLAEIDQKIRMLEQEKATAIASETEHSEGNTLVQLKQQSFPPCPLCDRPLDEHHWHLVLEKQQQQREEILSEIWVIREQLTTSEREIQVLRQEYTDIEKKLAQYGGTLERRGQLQEQLQNTAAVQEKLAQITAESAKLEEQLKTGQFELPLHEELQLLDRHLQQIDYDDRNHALARGSVDRWRWAEIRQAEIKQAKRRQATLLKRQPELKAQIEQIEQQLEQLSQELDRGLKYYDRQIAEIGYNLEQHNAIRAAIRQAQPWQLRYQELQQAKQNYPHVQQRLQELADTAQARFTDLQTITYHCQELIQALERTPDLAPHIQALEQQIQHHRTQLDEHLSKLGRLQQQQKQQEALSQQFQQINAQLKTARQQTRIYQELTQAFGKNGIQALMIENILPQLEATTNQILSRLSANQLHVQFVTQRNRKSKSTSAKAMETLDILIADAYGTRPYETYSGGEAFRVNFAIRLALARLLAQRSGTALQMLIVDEGFGTQDQEGCDRLIAAINAIAPEFACILTITHMPHFREAFQARIEVTKTQTGSELMLCL